MRVLIAGGSGFLGRTLSRALRQDGHRVQTLTRQPAQPDDLRWSADVADSGWTAALPGTDAVINLAGASIAGARWTAAQKARIRDSRLRATRALVGAINAAGAPIVLVSSSAIGIYGDRGDQPLNESAPPGPDYLAGVCCAWEEEAGKVTPAARLVLLRTGLVLARDGGALQQMAVPFRFGAGGPLGTGRQYMSWIHVDDWVGLVRRLLDTRAAVGPINLTAPAPVTNAEFARALGRALHRPALVPTPAFVLRLALGEMADALILGGQRVLPEKAQALGYEFRYPTVETALAAIYAGGSAQQDPPYASGRRREGRSWS
jgi:uncharacterized protein (TIGR01777 family)